jgi:hypothetical protein
MIDERELALWIKRLETEESSWSNYEKLAALYTIQNQNREPVRESRIVEAYSAASAPDSDFLRAVASVDPSRAWAVMDELMDSLKVVNERIYNNVMRKLE